MSSTRPLSGSATLAVMLAAQLTGQPARAMSSHIDAMTSVEAERAAARRARFAHIPEHLFSVDDAALQAAAEAH